MSILPRGVHVIGEVRALEDVVIEGRVDGPVWGEGRAIRIGRSGEVTGDIIGRDLVIEGRVHGRLIGSDIVHICAGAEVDGTVLAPRFVLEAGALFEGLADPAHAEAAVRVARFQQKARMQASLPGI